MEINDSQKVIELLNLKPLDVEGGYFRETYRSEDIITKAALPAFYNTERCFGTAIYYLLTPDSFSAIHKVNSDEIFHFYLGDPVEMLLLYPDGGGREIILGQDIEKGQQLQLTVPRGVWQGVGLRPKGKFALMGTTVSPGFEYADFILGKRKSLIETYPDYTSSITRLTR